MAELQGNGPGRRLGGPGPPDSGSPRLGRAPPRATDRQEVRGPRCFGLHITGGPADLLPHIDHAGQPGERNSAAVNPGPARTGAERNWLLYVMTSCFSGPGMWQLHIPETTQESLIQMGLDGCWRCKVCCTVASPKGHVRPKCKPREKRPWPSPAVLGWWLEAPVLSSWDGKLQRPAQL
ncbi:small integral membrane protein 10-like protein 2A isoform X1 [Ochotona princeps]|uniref:small integral membrane protein 10-like protein 2A isoform X1 n=1 Tax=Ochotona princeps TaxID=9978 RepID=UPI002714C26E|nr:small integral membrane protein 10-like protein 2A isoform X1 [Ochotona princeps]